MAEKKRTTFYIDTDLLLRAKLYCVANDISLSELVNQLLEKAIDGDQAQDNQHQE